MSRPEDQTAQAPAASPPSGAQATPPSGTPASPGSGPASAPSAQVLPQRFGRYLLQETIGRGGMAEVFRAVAQGVEGFQRVFVVKRILADRLADQKVSRDFVDMFINEARICAMLNHPNIVQVFDFGQIEGSFFLAMEYLRGKDLLTLLRELHIRGRVMPPELAAFVALQVATGLHHAHSLTQHGGKTLHIVHRDVSPSNIMLLRAGGVKLLDFGIAKAELEAEKPGTLAGPVKGKLAYLSPEQVRNETLDGRSDVFSLGVVLWECLTGKRLFFDKTDYTTMKNVLERPVPPPSTQRFDLPPQLDYIVVRALERDLAQRYPNAKVLAEDLESYLEQAHFSPSALPRLLDELFGEDKAEVEARVPVPAPPPPTADRPELLAAGESESPRWTVAAIPTGHASLAQPEETPKWTTTSIPVAHGLATGQGEQLRAAMSADAKRLAVRKRGPLPFVVGGLLLLGGAVALVLQGGTRQPASVPPGVASAPTPASLPGGAPPSPAPLPRPLAEAKPAPSAPAGMVSIRLESVPRGAQVKGPQDTVLGLTPTTATFPRSKQPVVLIFDRAGFYPARHSIVPDRDVTALVTLRQAPKGKLGRGKAARKALDLPIEEVASEIKIIDEKPKTDADRRPAEGASAGQAEALPPTEPDQREVVKAEEAVAAPKAAGEGPQADKSSAAKAARDKAEGEKSPPERPERPEKAEQGKPAPEPAALEREKERDKPEPPAPDTVGKPGPGDDTLDPFAPKPN